MSETRNRIYVDFLKTDGHRRLLLTTVGTTTDLHRLGIVLAEGLRLSLYSDDLDDAGQQDNLVVDGIAHYDEQRNRWVAVIDWDAIRHESEELAG